MGGVNVRAFVILGSAALSACLFPSLGGLSGDAGVADAADGNASDASPASDASDGGAGDSAPDASTFTANVGCKAANSDLLAYYTVNEGTGAKLYDCVASANSGDVLYAVHTAWVAGQHGKALELYPFAGVCVTVDFATPTFTFGRQLVVCAVHRRDVDQSALAARRGRARLHRRPVQRSVRRRVACVARTERHRAARCRTEKVASRTSSVRP